MAKNPKLTSNAANEKLSANHTAPAPRKERQQAGPSSAKALKKAWRKSGGGLSLKEYARKNEEGGAWLLNKQAT